MTLEDFKNIPFRMQDLSSVFPNCVNLAMKAKRLERDGEIMRTYYIGMVERAERSISLQNAKKIADALNVKLDVPLVNG